MLQTVDKEGSTAFPQVSSDLSPYAKCSFTELILSDVYVHGSLVQ